MGEERGQLLGMGTQVREVHLPVLPLACPRLAATGVVKGVAVADSGVSMSI